MPTFEIQMSDGNIYQVDAPDQNAALQAVQQMAGGGQQAAQKTPAARPELPAGMVQMPDGYVVDTEAVQAQQEKNSPVMSYLHGLAGNFLKGVPFVGSYADEAAGTVAGALGGDEQLATEMARRSQESFEGQNPGTAIAAQMAGGITATAPFMGAGGAAIASRPIGQVVAGGAGLGATEGAIYGYGAGETPEQRAQAAYEGALLGGGLGAVAPAAARAVGNAVNAARSAVGARQLNRQAGVKVGSQALKVLQEALAGGEKIADDELPLAFGNDSLVGLAGAVAASPGKGGGIVREAVGNAVAGRSEKVRQVLKDYLGDVPNVVKERDVMRDIQRRKANRLFGEAFENAPPLPAKPIRREISRMLEGMPPSSPTAKELRKLLKDVGDRRTLPLRYVHEMKRVVDGGIEKARRSGDRTLMADLMKVKNVLRDAGRQRSDAYARGLKEFADDAEVQSAFEFGRKALSPSVLRDELEAFITGSNVQVKRAAQLGARADIERRVATGRNAPFDAAREFADKPVGREKLGLLFGKDVAEPLAGALEKQRDVMRKGAQITSNSETARRMAFMETIKRGGIDEKALTEALHSGGMAGAAASLARRIAGAFGKASKAETMAQANEQLARLLSLTGKEKKAAIEALNRMAQQEGGEIGQAYAAIAAYLAGKNTMMEK